MSDTVAAAATAGGAVAAGMTATLYATGGGNTDVYVGLVLAGILFVGAVIAVLLEQVG